MSSKILTTPLSKADEQILMAFAQQHPGDLDGLLVAFFQFLHRFTDLYMVDDQPSRMGFRPGHAEAKVLAAFRSFPYKSLKSSENKPVAKEPTSRPVNAIVAQNDAPSDLKQTTSEKRPSGEKSILNISKPDLMESSVKTVETFKEIDNRVNDLLQTPKSATGKQIPVGNGGTGLNYTWTQTLHEINIHFSLERGTRGKDLICEIEKDSINLGRKHASGIDIILQGRFPTNEYVDVDASSWTVSDAGQLLVILTKKRESWWLCVVQGHPEIDGTMIDSSRKIDEYDDETQAAIRKLMTEKGQGAS